jgi:hypothetical protein
MRGILHKYALYCTGALVIDTVQGSYRLPTIYYITLAEDGLAYYYLQTHLQTLQIVSHRQLGYRKSKILFLQASATTLNS